MKTHSPFNRQHLPALLLGAIILLSLSWLALQSGNPPAWELHDWDLPYAGCSLWCS